MRFLIDPSAINDVTQLWLTSECGSWQQQQLQHLQPILKHPTFFEDCDLICFCCRMDEVKRRGGRRRGRRGRKGSRRRERRVGGRGIEELLAEAGRDPRRCWEKRAEGNDADAGEEETSEEVAAAAEEEEEEEDRKRYWSPFFWRTNLQT